MMLLDRFGIIACALGLASQWAVAAADVEILGGKACDLTNSCYLALRSTGTQSGGHIAPGPALASADCRSYLYKTVAYCPITKIVTSTTIRAAGHATFTVASTVTRTHVVSKVPRSGHTKFHTRKVTDTVDDTSPRLATVTLTTTVGAARIQPGQFKRDTDATTRKLNEAEAASFRESSSPVPPCVYTYAALATVPAYAFHACSQHRGSHITSYTSACSCNGVNLQYTTLPPSTVTHTTTLTQTILPISTVYATTVHGRPITKMVTRTALERHTDLSTVEVTEKEFITVHPKASTTTVRVTVTTTAAQEHRTGFLIRAIGGPMNNLYFAGSTENMHVGFTPNRSSATMYTLKQNVLTVASSGLVVNANPDTDVGFIYTSTADEVSTRRFLPLDCSISATSRLLCSTSNGNSLFFTCTAGGRAVMLGNDTSYSGCQTFTAEVVPLG